MSAYLTLCSELYKLSDVQFFRPYSSPLSLPRDVPSVSSHRPAGLAPAEAFNPKIPLSIHTASSSPLFHSLPYFISHLFQPSTCLSISPLRQPLREATTKTFNRKMEQIMDDTDVPTSLLRLYHLSRQIKAVLTQTQSVQACNILLDKRLGVFEASLDSSSLKELHEAIVVLQQRHDEEAAHRAQIEDELAFFKQSLHDKEEQNSAVQQLIQETANENRALQQSLLETVKENKSIKQKLNKFQTDLARVMLNMESLQGGQEEKNFQALNLKVNSAEKANGITSEQIDAVQQRMVFLEEENIKVKTSVAQLSAKLQAHPENNPKTSRVREATSTVLSPSKSRVILAAKHVKRLQRDKTYVIPFQCSEIPTNINSGNLGISEQNLRNLLQKPLD